MTLQRVDEWRRFFLELASHLRRRCANRAFILHGYTLTVPGLFDARWSPAANDNGRAAR